MAGSIISLGSITDTTPLTGLTVQAGSTIIMVFAVGASTQTNGYWDDNGGGGPADGEELGWYTSKMMYFAEIWYNVSATNGDGELSITTNAAGACAVAYELRGVETSNVLDQTANADGTSTTPSSGATSTTTQADEILVGWVSEDESDDAWASNTGDVTSNPQSANETGSNSYVHAFAEIVSSTGTYTMSGTLSDKANWGAGIATFKISAGGPQSGTTTETATINEVQTTQTTFNATCAESCSINDAPSAATEATTADFYSLTDVWVAPTSSGNQDYTFSGVTDTPIAAIIIASGTDATDGYDDTARLAIGFTDGTNSSCVHVYEENGQTTSDTYAAQTTSYIFYDGAWSDVTAAFVSFSAGKITLNWGGADIASNVTSLEITLFFGDNADVALVQSTAGSHVESLSFTSKLIFATTIGSTGVTSSDSTHSFGVCTNGTNGLTQFMSTRYFQNGLTSITGYTRISNAAVASELGSWETAISNIDSVGFNLSSSHTDYIYLLCFGSFNTDVDCGVSTIPTSGNISITDPGFEPAHLGVLFVTNTALDSTQHVNDSLITGIGAYDGTNENSVSITGTYGEASTNHTSVESSDIIHAEDADQTVEFDSSAVSLTSSGFDITLSTHPASVARYYGWWVIEAGAAGGPQSGTTTETATINEAQTTQVDFNSAGSESATINEAETVSLTSSSTGSESATINDTPTASQVHQASVSESATVNDAPAVAWTTSSATSETATINEVETTQVNYNSTGADTATINETEAIQVNFQASDAETATINEAQDTAEENLGTVEETATINDAPAVQANTNAAVAETATINEAQLGEETNASTTEETATINESATAQHSVQNDSVTESATVNDAPTVSQVQTSAGVETATVDDTETAQINFQVIDSETATINEVETVQSNYHLDVPETATINEVQITEEENEGATFETATIHDEPTVQSINNDTTAETATINETQTAVHVVAENVAETAVINEAETTQVDFQASDSETATIHEASSYTGAGEQQTLETATIDDTPAVQAVLNESESETATVDDAPTVSQVTSAEGSESATIDEAEVAQVNFNVSVSESATIDETETTQANVSASGSESATINEAQTTTTANEEAVSESATINEAETVQASLNATEDESVTINETSTTQQTSAVDVTESAGINEASITQQTNPVSESESVSIDESESAVRVLVASVLESLSIDDTPDSDLAAISVEIDESGDIDEAQTVQAVFYVDVTEELAISAVTEGTNLQNLFNDVYIKGTVKGYTIEGIVNEYTITG